MNPLDDVLQEQALKYLQRMQPKLDAFFACIGLLSNEDVSTLDATVRLAHDLTGSGGTYGFPGITERATEIEGLLKSLSRTRTAEKISMLDHEVKKLRRLVDELMEERTR